MFFKKQEKKKLNPWAVIVIGGLATVGAVSIFNMGRDFITEKGSAIKSFFEKKIKPCECGASEDSEG